MILLPLLRISSSDVARGKRLPGDVLGLLQSVRGERVEQEGVSRLSVGGSVRARAESDVSADDFVRIITEFGCCIIPY